MLLEINGSEILPLIMDNSVLVCFEVKPTSIHPRNSDELQDDFLAYLPLKTHRPFSCSLRHFSLINILPIVIVYIKLSYLVHLSFTVWCYNLDRMKPCLGSLFTAPRQQVLLEPFVFCSWLATSNLTVSLFSSPVQWAHVHWCHVSIWFW